MKTFDKKDVYSWSSAEEAKTYIGKTGYFNNDFESIKRAIELGDPAVLDRVDTNSIWCFKALGVSLCFGLFLPAEKVKELEEPKQYRSFKTIEEFFYIYHKNVGSLITYRIKANPLREVTTSIMGYIKEANIEDQLQLGVATLKLSAWHEVMEIWNEDEEQWQPFGVEE